MADTMRLGRIGRNTVGVRIPLPPPNKVKDLERIKMPKDTKIRKMVKKITDELEKLISSNSIGSYRQTL